jgi:hypothetical protein
MSDQSNEITIKFSWQKATAITSLLLNICLFGLGYYYLNATENKIAELRTKEEETGAIARAGQTYLEEEKNKIYKEIKAMQEQSVETAKSQGQVMGLIYNDFDTRAKGLVAWGTDLEKRIGSMVQTYDGNANAQNNFLVAQKKINDDIYKNLNEHKVALQYLLATHP